MGIWTNEDIRKIFKIIQYNIKTKTKVIITALEELVKKAKVSELKNFKGKIDLDIDLDTLRDRK